MLFLEVLRNGKQIVDGWSEGLAGKNISNINELLHMLGNT
jgi:hypothetical protein